MKKSAIKFYRQPSGSFLFTWEKGIRPGIGASIYCGSGIYKYSVDCFLADREIIKNFHTLNEAKAFVRSLLEV